MKKLPSIVFAALAVVMMSPASAGDLSDVFGKASAKNQRFGIGPQASYTDQHWISPRGCTYSRAQAPGYAPTWHLVLNGSQYGLTDAKPGCPVMMKTPGQ